MGQITAASVQKDLRTLAAAQKLEGYGFCSKCAAKLTLVVNRLFDLSKALDAFARASEEGNVDGDDGPGPGMGRVRGRGRGRKRKA